MLKRMQLGEANAKDFVKNMRNLTAKCFFKVKSSDFRNWFETDFLGRIVGKLLHFDRAWFGRSVPLSKTELREILSIIKLLVDRRCAGYHFDSELRLQKGHGTPLFTSTYFIITSRMRTLPSCRKWLRECALMSSGIVWWNLSTTTRSRSCFLLLSGSKLMATTRCSWSSNSIPIDFEIYIFLKLRTFLQIYLRSLSIESNCANSAISKVVRY